TYTAVRSLVSENGRICGAEVEDMLTGGTATIRAGTVINDAGPWSDSIRRMEDPAARPLLRTTRGVHIVVRRERIGHRHAITFLSPIDGRVMFILPWGELSYIGTTDTDTHDSPEAAAATEADMLYLLRSANARFPGSHLAAGDIVSSWARLRPLVGDDAGTASDNSREHVIVDGRSRLITVTGGKLTTYRSMAAETVDHAIRALPPKRRGGWPGESGTAREPLPGSEARDLAAFRTRGLSVGLPAETVEHLLRHYGSESAGILNLGMGNRALFERLDPRHPAIVAEVIHAARRELAQTVEDV